MSKWLYSTHVFNSYFNYFIHLMIFGIFPRFDLSNKWFFLSWLSFFNDPLMVLFFLGVLKILQRRSNVFVELRLEVVLRVLGIIMPLLLWFLGSHNEFVFQITFNDSQVVLEVFDIMVLTEVCNWVVDVIA